jgi:signal transduction histidine kinase
MARQRRMMAGWAAMSAEHPATAVVDPPGRTALRVVGLVGLVYVVAAATHPGTTGRHLAGLVLTLTTALAWLGWLAARHFHIQPLGLASLFVLAMSGGALVVLGPVGVAVVGVAALGAANTLELAPAAGIACLGVAAAGVGVAVTGHSATVIGGAATGAVAGIAIGVSMRQQQERLQHATQLMLARQRAEVANERAEVLAERNRIARDVHDVLAHTLSALSVQMEALDSLVDDDADRSAVHAAVRRSRRLAVEGLEETRRAVRVLRDEPVAVAEQIDALARDDGAALTVHGQAGPLPPAVGLALVRVAQESLTNARKHAPGTTVTMALAFDDDSTSLTVDNTAPSTVSALASTGGGYGVRGMRERVEILGGTFTAGPHDGGWRVRADLPT